MAIPGVDQDRIRDVLNRHLTPSAHITSPERLFGRGKKLIQIERAFNSTGRHVFIFGDRGVGKTSLAMTAAYMHQSAAEEPVYVLCSETTTFADIIYSAGINALPLKERMESQAAGGKFGGTFAGFGGSYEASKTPVASFGRPADLNEAVDIIRYINDRRKCQTVIVVDELERMTNSHDKIKLAEFINSISSVQQDCKFILAGIGQTVEDLLGAHRSATRKLEAIQLDPIPHNELWNIISTAANDLGVEVRKEHLERSSILSDGFPHYVHLIAESLFWAMFDDEEEVSVADTAHFRTAVKGALERTDVEHRAAYRRATEKTKNTKEYEATLWALADKTETRRQMTNIYNESYLKIQRKFPVPQMDKATLNHRLLSLRSPAHDEIVKGYGAGWFSFRETIMRGYVRLVAEDQGINLARDLSE